MGGFHRRYRGQAAAAGVVPMDPEPDFSMGKDTWSEWLAVSGVRRIALQADDLDGIVELQGNNGRPGEAGEWYELGTLSADGRIVIVDDPVDFIRVNCTALTSGTPTMMLTLEA